MSFPIYRPRRLRAKETIRRMVRETNLTPSDFILPLFVTYGKNVKNEIKSRGDGSALPGIRARRPVRSWLGADEAKQRVYGVAVPGMLSWMLRGDAKAPVAGLLAFAPEDRPPVQLVFQSYHLMVGVGMVLIGIALAGTLYAARLRPPPSRWLLRLFVASVLGPQIANQAGWMTAEVGRQPWIVYGLMRTNDGISRSVSAEAVVFSLVLFTLVYAMLFALFLFLLDSKIKHGPLAEDLTAGPQRA